MECEPEEAFEEEIEVNEKGEQTLDELGEPQEGVSK